MELHASNIISLKLTFNHGCDFDSFKELFIVVRNVIIEAAQMHESVRGKEPYRRNCMIAIRKK